VVGVKESIYFQVQAQGRQPYFQSNLLSIALMLLNLLWITQNQIRMNCLCRQSVGQSFNHKPKIRVTLPISLPIPLINI